jgi:hypothetical protein
MASLAKNVSISRGIADKNEMLTFLALRRCRSVLIDHLGSLVNESLIAFYAYKAAQIHCHPWDISARRTGDGKSVGMGHCGPMTLMSETRTCFAIRRGPAHD